jgi:hypothetical protein
MVQTELADRPQRDRRRGCVLPPADHQVVGVHRHLAQDRAGVAADDTSHQHRPSLDLAQGARYRRILEALGTLASLLRVLRRRAGRGVPGSPHGDDVQTASAQTRLAHRERESVLAVLASVDTDDELTGEHVVHDIPSIATDYSPTRADLAIVRCAY